MRVLTAAVAAALVLLPAAPAHAANSAPVAVNDSVSYRNTGGTDYVVDALANDSDPDGDTLAYTAVGAATKGSAYLSAGKLYYKPSLGNTGTDSFTYTVADGQGNTATGTVTATLWVDPSAPGDVAITGSGTTSATVTWSAAARAASYRVYRDGVLVTDTPSLTFTDGALTATGSYEYHVVAVNGGGFEGPASGSVYRRARLASPGGFFIDPTDDPTKLSLTWYSGWQPGPWNVYRDGAQVATVPQPDPLHAGYVAFVDTGLVTGQQYSYQVQAARASSSTEVFPPSLRSGAVRVTPSALTAIGRYFLDHGGTPGELGWVTTAERVIPGGRMENHANGNIVQRDGEQPISVRWPMSIGYSEWYVDWNRLGFPLGEQQCGLLNNGCVQIFDNGSIWNTPSPAGWTPVRVFPDIDDGWAANGRENGRLGYPSGNEVALRDGGIGQAFEGGGVYWSAATGAHAVFTAYRDVWARYGSEAGRLGFPISDEICGGTRGGCYQVFQGGYIYWSMATGLHAVFTAYGSVWARSGWEAGRMGYPTTDEICGGTGGGCYQVFQGGTIYWSMSTGLHAVFAPYGQVWGALGWEAGRLGYPTTDEICGRAGGGCYQVFQGGYIYWSAATGVHAVFTAYGTVWARYGWEAGRLGYPTTDEICGRPGSGCYQRFQGGTISWSPTSGFRVG